MRIEPTQKLLPRFAQSYWDIKFQMERQSKVIKHHYSRFQLFRPKTPQEQEKSIYYPKTKVK